MKAFVFPGQGSQFIGMGKDLAEAFPAAREVFQEVDDALSQSLSKIMFEGPDTDLNLTENTQPALMAVSVAVARVLQQAKPDLFTTAHCAFVAGHSLGEYSALTAAGSFNLSDAARLLKLRGQSMQKAVPVGVGAMAAILGLELPDVTDIVKAASSVSGSAEIVAAANDNSFGQVVVSGHKAAVEKAVALATERGAKRAILLPVSAPFHCPLMQPAADAMRDALAQITLRAPSVPLVANVIASEVTDPAQIKNLLVEQVTGMVRWRESVMYMKTRGVTETVELGAGKVLTGLTKRIEGDMTGRAVGTPKDIEEFLK
ncbi:MAG TPA: ACP S-malonyltransferase [Alphaproteobacteria bacterium]|nr:[acyl-carrier-protein] S-malonyltransferase [Rhodospirillaceae bacterium]HRJ65708.1 ACP S-malonyltransferase [Alphaproteobacteria bacterium]